MLHELPLERIEPQTFLGPQAFHRQQGQQLRDLWPASGSLVALWTVLRDWLFCKASNDHKRRRLIPETEQDYRINDLLWKGFYLTDQELERITTSTVMEFAVPRGEA